MTTNIPDLTKIPETGTLIVPRHKPESFCTILEVQTPKPGPDRNMALRVMYLRISDNKKIHTVWYPNPETFWKYYEEK